MKENPDLLSASAAADFLGTSRTSLYRLAENGALHPERREGRPWYSRAELEELRDARETQKAKRAAMAEEREFLGTENRADKSAMVFNGHLALARDRASDADSRRLVDAFVRMADAQQEHVRELRDSRREADRRERERERREDARHAELMSTVRWSLLGAAGYTLVKDPDVQGLIKRSIEKLKSSDESSPAEERALIEGLARLAALRNETAGGSKEITPSSDPPAVSFSDEITPEESEAFRAVVELGKWKEPLSDEQKKRLGEIENLVGRNPTFRKAFQEALETKTPESRGKIIQLFRELEKAS